jgi:putative redox protein
MAVEMDIVYEGDLRCSATHGPSRTRLITDAPVDNGGQGRAFSPTDLIATGLATCVATIMGQAAKRKGFNIDGTRIHVSKEMTTAGLRRISRLQLEIEIPGGNTLSPEQRAVLETAADLCPVKKSLHPEVEIAIHYRYE